MTFGGALVITGAATFLMGMALNSTSDQAGIFCALGAGAIILGLASSEQAGRFRVPSFLVALGGASYSIYLVHFSTITLLAASLNRLHSNIPVSAATFLTIAAYGVSTGLVFDRFVDKPAQRLLRRRLKPVFVGCPSPSLPSIS